jgi:hypothetical protein
MLKRATLHPQRIETYEKVAESTLGHIYFRKFLSKEQYYSTKTNVSQQTYLTIQQSVHQ